MTNSVVGGIRTFGGNAVMQGTNALTLGGGNDWAYGGVGSSVLNLAPDSILNLANQSRLGLNVRGGSAIKGERATINFGVGVSGRSEEHTSELQSLMRISYAVFCLKKKKH